MARLKTHILIITAEKATGELLADNLPAEQFHVALAQNGATALDMLDKGNFEIVFLDVRSTGLNLLRVIHLKHNHTTAIIVVGGNDIDSAVEAMQMGAADYIPAPPEAARVASSLRHALDLVRNHKPLIQIDAIAAGVEAGLDPYAAFSGVIVERTSEIARQMGIAERDIQAWVKTKAKSDVTRSH